MTCHADHSPTHFLGLTHCEQVLGHGHSMGHCPGPPTWDLPILVSLSLIVGEASVPEVPSPVQRPISPTQVAQRNTGCFRIYYE